MKKEKMETMCPYSGGPYLQFGTILSACAIEPINLPYGRVSDRLQDVMDNLYTVFIPWEWWIDYTGKVYMGQKRGNDRTATIHLVHGERLNIVDAQRSTKQTAQRVRVTGSGEGREQDDATSDWQDDAGAMDVINTFYETIQGNRDISQKAMADILAQVLLTQTKDPREEVTINDVDLLPYTANDVDIADYITVTDSWTGLNGSQRIKTYEKTIDADGGEVVNLTLTKKRTDISDRLAFLHKKLNELLTSNTAISKLMNFGSKQDQIDPNKLEDIWKITAANKNAFEMPEESTVGADDENIVFSQAVGTGSYSCSKDEFYVCTSGGAGDDVRLYNVLLSLDWESNPKFSCDFEIDTDIGNIWEEDDYVDIGIKNSGQTLGFYFRIKYSNGSFHIYCCLSTTVPPFYEVEILPIGGITYDTKYRLEAEVDWEGYLVRYYFGSPTQDFGIVGVFPLPYTEGATGQELRPVMIRLVDNGASVKYVYIYNWRSQGKALYSS